ncbi:ricin-type beta-trefoil lectin domain protein [Streptomyces sp. NPDC019531]|uniref:ricin-type beta-trefoil lectin domain protein n=1 Tax=Streptomyces sp. NPDC019531 TaxID=3365062 RepID=UPI00384B41E6
MSADPEQVLAPAVSPSAAVGASGNEGGGESTTRPDTATGRSASGALTTGAGAADAPSGAGSAREVTETGAVPRNQAEPESASSSNDGAAQTTTAGARRASDAESQESGVVVAVGSMPPGGDDEDGGEDSGKPKKPFLAAAAITGVVLAAVPLLIFVMDRSDDAEKKTVSAAEVGAPVDDAGAEEPPALYVPDKPKNDKTTPKPSPTKSPSHQPRKSSDAGADAKPTPTPAKAKPQVLVQKTQQSGGRSASVVAYQLVSGKAGKCLSADRASDGAALYIWDCDGSREQKWSFDKDGTIRLKGLCMDVADASLDKGAVVQLARCSGNSAQQFLLKSNKKLFAVSSGFCLDVWWGKSDNGTPVKTWDCIDGQVNQAWTRT